MFHFKNMMAQHYITAHKLQEQPRNSSWAQYKTCVSRTWDMSIFDPFTENPNHPTLYLFSLHFFTCPSRWRLYDYGAFKALSRSHLDSRLRNLWTMGTWHSEISGCSRSAFCMASSLVRSALCSSDNSWLGHLSTPRLGINAGMVEKCWKLNLENYRLSKIFFLRNCKVTLKSLEDTSCFVETHFASCCKVFDAGGFSVTRKCALFHPHKNLQNVNCSNLAIEDWK